MRPRLSKRSQRCRPGCSRRYARLPTHVHPPSLPPFTLRIQQHANYCLLRNFSVERGLVKNVRVKIVHLRVGVHIVSVKLVRNNSTASPNNDELFLIPRISFTDSLRSGRTLLRMQFPLAPAYAATFNSCQSLTLDCVAIDLTHPVFSHGQLHTAMSRVRRRDCIMVRVDDDEVQTSNITYTELL